MRNKYPGSCYRCGERVEVGEGHFELLGRKFRVQHATCAIKFRGQPDPARIEQSERNLQWRAKQTGRKGQRARKALRDREATFEDYAQTVHPFSSEAFDP